MGLFKKLIKGTVGVALTPLAIAADTARFVTGEPEKMNNTAKTLENAGKNLMGAVEDLSEGKL